MNLPFYIARRYLFAHKSHNVINLISAISAIGMAIGTAALIIILSVYNGFDGIIKSSLSDIDPDLLVSPFEGKVFSPDEAWLDSITGMPGVGSVGLILQDQVFIDYDGQQGLASARGVEPLYSEVSGLSSHLIAGKWSLGYGETPFCAVGAALAYKLSLEPVYRSMVDFYYPERTGSISLSTPASSLRHIRMRPSCTFSVNSTIDESLIILPLEQMRELTGYTSGECTAIEVRMLPGYSTSSISRQISSELGPGFKVAGRAEQNSSLYKMMRYEKAAIFLILIFVVIIIAFNIFGSLSMLMIEKRQDIGTLYSMGATDGMIRRIFVLEGWLISLIGLVVGLVVGIGFALLQQRFGLIKMPGNYLVEAYPIVLHWSDVVLTTVGVALIGYLIALLPTRELKSYTYKQS